VGAAGSELLSSQDRLLAWFCHGHGLHASLVGHSHLLANLQACSGCCCSAIAALQFSDSLPNFRGGDPDIGGPEFGTIWNMIGDMTDGFSRLSTAYQDFVSQNMNSVLGLHTAVFVLRWATWCLPTHTPQICSHVHWLQIRGRIWLQ
jgi:hypothetical protein